MSVTSRRPAPGARIVPCPGCGAPTPYGPDNPWRPFCSERCRNGDLGAWSSESYRVAVKPTETDDDIPETQASRRDAPRH